MISYHPFVCTRITAIKKYHIPSSFALRLQRSISNLLAERTGGLAGAPTARYFSLIACPGR
jgi:hypothetical protein